MARPRKDGTPAQGNPGGKKPYQPEEADRKRVEAMTGYGLTHDQIASVIGISDETLRKYFRRELDTGAALANSRVAQNLYKWATSDKPGAVAASIFWTKTRMGWREVTRQEHTGPNGGPIQTETKKTLDVTKLSPEDLESLEGILTQLDEGGE
jgi:hypothetical protein